MSLFTRKKSDKSSASVRLPHLENQAYYTFRRSRTITGTVSDDIKVAGESSAQLRSDRLKTHDLKKHRRRVSGVLLLCLACCVVIYSLLSQAIFSTVAVSDDPTRESVYNQTVSQYFAERSGERFAFLLQVDALKQFMQQKHPEIADVSVELTGVMRPADVKISLRKAVASWVIGGKQYYIDSSGVAFETLFGEVPALVVDDKSGIDPNSSASVAPERMVRYVGRLVALLSEKGQGVERLELPLLTSREVDVYLKGRGYPFKTSIDRDPAGQVADIMAMLSYLDKHQIVPQSYVDSRVSSKAFYR